jgi:hypothetical protein
MKIGRNGPMPMRQRDEGQALPPHSDPFDEDDECAEDLLSVPTSLERLLLKASRNQRLADRGDGPPTSESHVEARKKWILDISGRQREQLDASQATPRTLEWIAVQFGKRRRSR